MQKLNKLQHFTAIRRLKMSRNCSSEFKIKAQRKIIRNVFIFLRTYSTNKLSLQSKQNSLMKKRTQKEKIKVFNELKAYLNSLNFIKKKYSLLANRYLSLKRTQKITKFINRRSQNVIALSEHTIKKQKKVIFQIFKALKKYSSNKIIITKKLHTNYSFLIDKKSKKLKKNAVLSLKLNVDNNGKIVKKFANLVKCTLKSNKLKNIKKIQLDKSKKLKIEKKFNEFKVKKQTQALQKGIIKLFSNSKITKKMKTNKDTAISHFDYQLLRKYFNNIHAFKEFSQNLKININEFSSNLLIFLRNKQKTASFFLIKQLYTNQKQKEISIREELKKSLLKRMIQTWSKQTKSKAALIYNQDILQLKHESLLKYQLFKKWLKAFNYKEIEKKISSNHKQYTMRYHFRLWTKAYICKEAKKKIILLHKSYSLRSYLKLWHIELKILELEKKRNHKYLVFSFAGLQIYSEKTFQAKACIKRVSIYETFNFMKKLFKDWRNYANMKRKELAVVEINKLNIERYVMSSLKNHYYMKLISKEVYKRCKKNTAYKFFSKWQIKLKEHIRRLKMIKILLLRKILHYKKYSFAAWKPQGVHSSLEETRARQSYSKKPEKNKEIIIEHTGIAVKHYESNLVLKVFYAWDNMISQYSIKRKRAFMHSVFSGWRIVTRETSLLKKYLIESDLSERYLRSSRDIGIGTLKSISSLGSFASNN